MCRHAAGDEKGAGTDSDIQVSLTGVLSANKPSTHRLVAGKDAFERGSCDSFVVDAPDHGPLTVLELSRDNSGRSRGWLCEQVVITDCSTEEKFTFPVDTWLDAKRGLSTKAKVSDGNSKLTNYSVRIQVPPCHISATPCMPLPLP